MRAVGGAAGSLWDEALPIEVRELPGSGALMCCCRFALLAPIVERFGGGGCRPAGCVDGWGPTIAMETYIRLMVLKPALPVGYRSLVAEVSDSIHLRRFCRSFCRSGCRR